MQFENQCPAHTTQLQVQNNVPLLSPDTALDSGTDHVLRRPYEGQVTIGDKLIEGVAGHQSSLPVTQYRELISDRGLQLMPMGLSCHRGLRCCVWLPGDEQPYYGKIPEAAIKEIKSILAAAGGGIEKLTCHNGIPYLNADAAESVFKDLQHAFGENKSLERAKISPTLSPSDNTDLRSFGKNKSRARAKISPENDPCFCSTARELQFPTQPKTRVYSFDDLPLSLCRHLRSASLSDQVSNEVGHVIHTQAAIELADGHGHYVLASNHTIKEPRHCVRSIGCPRITLIFQNDRCVDQIVDVCTRKGEKRIAQIPSLRFNQASTLETVTLIVTGTVQALTSPRGFQSLVTKDCSRAVVWYCRNSRSQPEDALIDRHLLEEQFEFVKDDSIFLKLGELSGGRLEIVGSHGANFE